MDHQTDPDEILELVFCDCKKAKFTEQGQCALLQIPSFLVQIFANAKSNVIMKSQHHIHTHTHTHTHTLVSCLYNFALTP